MSSLIREARVIVTCPDRNFVTLKLVTDDGVSGIGDATLNGREMAVVAYLQEHICPLLIGRDAAQIEDMWQSLYRGAYWRRGPVTMCAIAAVDTALWDIKAKMAGMPLYQLLGGRCREGVLVYGHCNGADIAQTVDNFAHYQELGYKAIRVQTGVPGLGDIYGVGRGAMHYEPADTDLPREEQWSTEKYLRYVPGLFDAVRKRYGSDPILLHDSHHRLTPIQAGKLGKRIEEYDLYWLEDAVPAENQESFRILRQHTTQPLAVGEVFNTIFDCQTLIREQLIDYIRTCVVHAGGITHLRRIASFAALYNVKTGCHGATDMSPVCMGAALHFDLSTHNFGIQEYMRHSTLTDEVFPHSYSFDDGYMQPGDKPGHGVELNEELAAKFPYKRAYLPVARLMDGTASDW